MGLDIRLPIGLMFTLLGVLLTGFGVVSDKIMYRRSLDININLWWGLALLLFGLVMFLYGRKGSQGMRPAETSPEGQLIEQLEHRTGKESEESPQQH
jgi:hypothetical protein